MVPRQVTTNCRNIFSTIYFNYTNPRKAVDIDWQHEEKSLGTVQRVMSLNLVKLPCFHAPFFLRKRVRILWLI